MIKKINIVFLSLLLLLSCEYYVAQKQANIWHFGLGQCVDFSSGNAVQVSGSAIQSFEGSASYCDPAGNLLFYTNGGGREPDISGQDGGHIWNRNNAVMYDMQGIEGGGFSSAQSSVVVEAPGQQNVYYVFTMDEIEYNIGASSSTNTSQPFGRGFSYFTVDMTLNGGLGGVVLANQNVFTPSAEGLCAIRHANNHDYWLLINQDTLGIGVYLLNSSGISLANVYSGVQSNFQIKASPNGRKVNVRNALLDFDPASGQLSNPITLNLTADYFEFSPNSQFLYAAVVLGIGDEIQLIQFDLDAANIPSTQTVIGTLNGGFSFPGQMQLAPDGKIYLLEHDLTVGIIVLNRIACPNLPSASLEQDILTLGNEQFIGLPNFPAWIFENYDATYVALGQDTLTLCTPGQTYTLDAQNPGATYQWSTGETTQIISVNSPGTYSVMVNGPCGSGSDQVVVTACPSNTNCIEFVPTGSIQTWIVPTGVNLIEVKMWGAAGGGGPDPINNAGGGGGYTEFTMEVTPGDQLEISVGTAGQVAVGNTGGIGGWPSGGNGGSGNRIESINGSPMEVGGAGGGGGATLIRTVPSNVLLAAAGGGGGAAFNRSGGGGGGLEAEYSATNNEYGLCGFGGTQTAGGSTASNEFCPHPVSGTAGSFLLGGIGATDLGGSSDRVGGGGGGDGYYGGGGGGSQDGCFGVGSPGGGGSGYVCNSCIGLTGFTQTAGFFGEPANVSDPLLLEYTGTATGSFNQNGGGGLVQICFSTGCITTTTYLTLNECNSYTSETGEVFTESCVFNYTLQSVSGCDSIISVNLTITEDPTITVTPSFATILQGDSIQIQANGAVTYQWSPVSGLSCSDCENPLASPNQTTSYTVTGTNAIGCTNSQSILITVLEDCKEVFIPTIFSPNADGFEVNEELCLFGNCINSFQLEIFNRWGEKVFESTDLSNCWDGFHEGNKAEAGVYVYKLVITKTNGERILDSGNITLVR